MSDVQLLAQKIVEAHSRELAELAIQHAAEVGRLKARIADLESQISGKDPRLTADLTGYADAAVSSSPEPDWSQAPEWAQWWASDWNGHSYWYERRPQFQSDGVWHADTLGKYEIHGANPSFHSTESHDSLRQRPQEPAGFTTPDCPVCGCVDDGQCLCKLPPAADAEGWIKHDGRECPVEFHEKLDAILAGGIIVSNRLACELVWQAGYPNSPSVTVIAYRPHRPAAPGVDSEGGSHD